MSDFTLQIIITSITSITTIITAIIAAYVQIRLKKAKASEDTSVTIMKKSNIRFITTKLIVIVFSIASIVLFGYSTYSVTTLIISPTSVPLESIGLPAAFMSENTPPERYINYKTSVNGGINNSNCIEIEYIYGAIWAGIMWWPSNCGKDGNEQSFEKARNGNCGVNIIQYGNFKEILRLTFWAKGKTGNEIIEFKVGATDIEPSPARSTGPIKLANTWTKYKINLVNMNLSNAASLFTWVATDESNKNGAVFFLDDIQFEGTIKR